MNVRELITRLERYAAELGDDVEVKVEVNEGQYDFGVWCKVTDPATLREPFISLDLSHFND